MSYFDWIGPAVFPSLVISILGLLAASALRKAPSSARHLTLTSAFLALALVAWALWVPWPEARVANVSGVERAAAEASSKADSRWLWLALIPVLVTSGRYLLGLICLWRASRSYSKVQATGAARLAMSSSARTAYVSGVLRPTIVLPDSYLALEPSALEAIILHEEAHVKQGDVVLIPIVAFVQGLFWWNPLIHLLAHHWRLESERAADDAVLEMGIAPHLYARQLLDLAQGLAGRAPLAGSALIGRGRMRNRILAVLNPNIRRKPMNNKKKWITVAACAGIALSLSVVAQARWSAAKQSEHSGQWKVKAAPQGEAMWVIEDGHYSVPLKDGPYKVTRDTDKGLAHVSRDGATLKASSADGRHFKGEVQNTGAGSADKAEAIYVEGHPLVPQGKTADKPN